MGGFPYGQSSKGGYKPRFNTYNKGTGAKEGLERKMKYWNEKDFNYEYGVSIGAAANLAMQALREKDPEGSQFPSLFEEMTYSIFSQMLDMKSSIRFKERFKDYYEQTHPDPKESVDGSQGSDEPVIQQGTSGNLL